MSIEFLTTFLGWCTVVNIGVLVIAIVMLGAMHDFVGNLTARIFGISSEDAKKGIYIVVQQYRLAVFFFNLVPYVVLKIMAVA